jgi:hypothetical protein
MRTLYYVLLFVCLLLVLFCVNFVRWLVSKSQLALLSLRRWILPRSREWRRESPVKPSPSRRSC